MRSTRIRLRRVAAVLVAASIGMMLAPAASAIDNNCYYKVVGSATITTYGEIINKESKSYVPLGGVTYVYYESYCDPSGVYTDPTTGGPVYTPMRPRVAFKSINTTDPYRPLLIVDVDSDPYYPATSLKVTVGGSTVATLPLVGDGQYEVALRSVGDYTTSSTKAIVGTACNASNVCGSVSGSMTRYKAPYLSKDEMMYAGYLSGDEFFNVPYGHQYLQGYMTTSFTMPELAQNSRRQLRLSLVKLRWTNTNYNVAVTANVHSTGTLYGNNFSTTPSCYDVPVCSGYCTHKCVDSGAFGFMISTQDIVLDLMMENWQRMAVTSGGQLSHTIP
jgi:hypothetical protein